MENQALKILMLILLTFSTAPSPPEQRPGGSLPPAMDVSVKPGVKFPSISRQKFCFAFIVHILLFFFADNYGSVQCALFKLLLLCV